MKTSPQKTQAITTSSVIGATPENPYFDGSNTITPVGFPMNAPHISPIIPRILENHPKVSNAITAIGIALPLYPNDQFITEAEVSSRFQVSRTPAREALNILCQEGILEKIPRKGYIIRKLSLSELQELCQYRSILECGAVEYAIRFASDSELEKIYQIANKKIDLNDSNFYNHYNELNLEFHLSIARITNNSYLISAMENVFYRLRRDLVIDGRSNLENSLDMHIQLAAAMKKRDLEQARRITADQIEFVEKRLYLH